jgi:hypothetical protein
MAGLVPAMTTLLQIIGRSGVDARVKPGHDDGITSRR